MPGKSQSRKGQYANQSKKKKSRSGRPAVPAQLSAIAQARQPVSPPNVPTAPASAPVPTAKLTPTQYPHIAGELRTIGVLAGIILIILVVLALVLS